MINIFGETKAEKLKDANIEKLKMALRYSARMSRKNGDIIQKSKAT